MTRTISMNERMGSAVSIPVRSLKRRSDPALISRAASRKAIGASQEPPPRITLTRAVQIAAVALQNLTDEAGQPIILHVLHVTDACCTEEKRIVALLHEVVGRSRWTLSNLRRESVPDTVLDAVHTLTRVHAETRAASADHAPKR